MAGALCCEVLSLLAEHRCSPGAAAAALAFAPPSPPSYLLRRARHPAASSSSSSATAAGVVPPPPPSSSSAAAYEWVLDEGLEPASWPDTLITQVLTRRRRKIPVFVFVFAGAPLTVLYSHGNAADAGHMRAACVDLCANLRCNVVLYDYTGFGAAAADGAQPSEADCYADVEAVYDFCLRPGGGGDGWGCRAPEQVVLYGESIGSGPACWLARRRPCRALVLHAPVLSGLRVVLDHLAPPQSRQRREAAADEARGGGKVSSSGRGRGAELAAACLRPCDVFPNLHRVAGLRAGAVLVLHGLRDEEVDASHGRALHAALPLRYRRQRPEAATSVSASGAGKEEVAAGAGADDAAALAAAADPAAPWFPSLAGHNNLRELYRSEYFLRLRAFLLMLGPPVAAPADGKGGAPKVPAVEASVEAGPAPRLGISREALAFLRAPLWAPQACGPLVTQLQNAATSPPGPGSRKLEAAPGAPLVAFLPLQNEVPVTAATGRAPQLDVRAAAVVSSTVATPSPLVQVAARSGLSVTAMMQVFRAPAAPSAEAGASSDVLPPPPLPPPPPLSAQLPAQQALLEAAGAVIPARRGSVLAQQQQQLDLLQRQRLRPQLAPADSRRPQLSSPVRRASFPTTQPLPQLTLLPQRLLQIASLRGWASSAAPPPPAIGHATQSRLRSQTMALPQQHGRAAGAAPAPASQQRRPSRERERERSSSSRGRRSFGDEADEQDGASESEDGASAAVRGAVAGDARERAIREGSRSRRRARSRVRASASADPAPVANVAAETRPAAVARPFGPVATEWARPSDAAAPRARPAARDW